MKKFIFLYTISLLFFACKDKTETAKNSETTNALEITLTKEQLKNTQIETGFLTQQPLSTTLKVNGKITLAPQAMASVSLPLGGYVKNINVMQGMQIAKGQVLAIVEDVQYVQLQQDYLTTKEQLAFLYKDFQRQKELNASKAVSDKTFEMAQNEMAKQRIALKSLEEKLRLANINPKTLTANSITKSVQLIAPISGIVSKTNINLGKYVNPTDMLFEIINNHSLFLTLNVFDKDAAHLYTGQKIKAYSNSNSELYATQILFINKSVNENNAMEIVARIQNPKNRLMVGNYMNAEIETTIPEAKTINNQAIVSYEGKDYLFIQVSQEKYQMTPVILGQSNKDFTEVKNALDFKDKTIVTKDAYTLLMVLKNKEE
ncbi:efflux RND transporter periplasmic adaptor subunit [Flavobacterium sp.]|uniref:efflux RND transporter periplasmic adaptor subunit n=1 Tax=Flavobacterium sp. TaxID=239 RepID=UPI003D0CA162